MRDISSIGRNFPQGVEPERQMPQPALRARILRDARATHGPKGGRLMLRSMLAAALTATVAFAAPALAQDFPNRTVTLVIPFAAGGSTDLVGRLIAERMTQEL